MRRSPERGLRGGRVVTEYACMGGRTLLRVALAAAVTGTAALAFGAARTEARPLPSAPNCAIFPSTNVWNKRVDSLPVAANSAAMIKAIGLNTGLHPDFGSYLGYGIPFNVVTSATHKVSVRFQYSSESNRGPYPIPGAPADRGRLRPPHADRRQVHLHRCTRCGPSHHTSSGWTAGSGAIWNMESNHLRHDGWTSADAAGLPILPGLARYQRTQTASSTTRCASPRPAPAPATSTRPGTTPAPAPATCCRRWACACGCGPTSPSTRFRRSAGRSPSRSSSTA